MTRGGTCADHAGRLGHMQTAAGLDPDAGEIIPAAQFGERNAKAVGDRDKRVATAHSVEHAVCGGRSLGSNGHH